MYKAAVIGLGRMGSTFDDEISQGGSIFLPYAHGPSYVASPQTRLVAGADPHPEQRAIFAERWGLTEEQTYADYREMLAREQPEIVSVCTTARHRATILQDVIQAGVRAIWAEKPLALSLAEADTVAALCQEHGVTLAINCARRWNPFMTEARRMIQAGEFGEVLQITAYAQCHLSHNGSHAIDTMRYLIDSDVAWVFGEMESDEKAADEEDLMGNGYLAFENGVRGFLRGMPTGMASWEFDVIGTEGRFRYVGDGSEPQLFRRMEGGRRNRGVAARVPFPLPTNIPGTGLSVVADLIRGIETGALPRCSVEDGRKALEIAVALRQSHRLGGQRVDLPLADRSQRILSVEIAQDGTPARVRRMQAS